jgi:DNA polymerase (family 10)
MHLKLESADKHATKLMETLGPYCDKIAVAGSIRRRRPIVGDIDLVVLTRDPAALKARCKQTCVTKTDGRENFICETSNGIQIDIFFAQHAQTELFNKVPGTWGSILLCRTGSIAHNIYLVEHAKTLGLTWNPYAGVLDADYNILASETEEEIFATLKLEFIPPEERER